MQNLKHLVLVLFIIWMTTSCGHNLVEDQSPPAVEANYYTAEFRACNTLWHGLGVCKYNDGQEIAIQGYYKGIIRVTYSENRCGNDVQIDYVDNEKVKVPVLEGNCMVGFTVQPELPQGSEPIKVYSFAGMVWFRNIDSTKSWAGYLDQISKRHQVYTKKISTSFESSPKLVLMGCSQRYDFENPEIKDGKIVVNLPENSPDKCVYEGRLFNKEDATKDEFFTWFTIKYSDVFIPLAHPSLKWKFEDVIEVWSDSSISIISIDGKWKIDRDGRFKNIDKNKKHIFRALTVKGRSSIAVWNVDNQLWEWR